VLSLENAVDDLQQYSHRNCVVLHDCPKLLDAKSDYYKFEADIDARLNKHLQGKIQVTDIDITHPLPRSRNGKTHVIIKFIKRSVKNLVFNNKKCLAKSGLSLTESLTKRRISILTEAKNQFKKENVINDNIYCSIQNERYPIQSMDDIQELKLVSKNL